VQIETDVLFRIEDQNVLYNDYKQEQKIAQIMPRQILNILVYGLSILHSILSHQVGEGGG
jgi:hypothetical protein